MKVADWFPDISEKLIKSSVQTAKISPENVYQMANLENRELFNSIIHKLLLPGSQFVNIQTMIDFGSLARVGKSCLILMEHYSNFDIPNFFYLLHQEGPQAAEVAEQVIAMAGAKLNEDSSFVRAFTEAFSRIVIFPSRSLDSLRKKGEEAVEEIQRARAINMAALHQMVRTKHAGHIILVFPSGTRYRPGEEETKRGLREMDSYIKQFDHLLFIGGAGNTLRINVEGIEMSDDTVAQDVVVFNPGKITNAHEFRASVKPAGPDQDPKQAVADAIMAELEKLHIEAERIRTDALAGIG